MRWTAQVSASPPCTGSTFKVYLPAVAEPQHVERAVLPEIASPTGTETILIAEDEVSVRTLAATMLRTIGYTVIETSSPLEALRLTDEQGDEISLLLTDLVMPEMSGSELAEQITARNPNVRVLFMSGYAYDGVHRSGELPARAAYLEKPFSHRDLALKVREVLDRVGTQPSAPDDRQQLGPRS